jgi:phosphoribosyl 1,2-cyclic phosphate phosphodiesterase
MKTIDDTELPYLEGVETLILNALRHETHPSHQTIEEAITFSRRIGTPETYFIHMSHHTRPHAIEDASLPPHFHLAYDGLEIEV